MRVRFDPSDAFELAAVLYMITLQSKDGIVLQQVDNADITLSFSHDEVTALLKDPTTRLRRGFFSKHRAVSRLHTSQKYLATAKPKARLDALWREVWVQVTSASVHAKEINRTETSITQFMPVLRQRVNAICVDAQYLGASGQAGTKAIIRKAPCAKTLLNWLRRYERAGGCPLSLMNKQRCETTYVRRFGTEVMKVLNACLWEFLSLGKPTPAKIVRDTQDHFKELNAERATDGLPDLVIPSASDIKRRASQLKKFQCKVGRYGKSAAVRDMSIYQEGLKIFHPLQWVEMDEWKIDVYSLLDEAGCLDGLSEQQKATYKVGRRWLCLAIDVATRCVVGMRLAQRPTPADAISTLSLITMDKTPLAQAAGCESGWGFFGGCGTVSTDMGPAFIADEYRVAVADLRFTQSAPAAGVPKLRGHVERIFGTFASQLMVELTGRSFSNSKERGDYPGEDLAAVTDDDLVRLFTRFVVDIYHNVPHAGLDDETPANAWKRLAKEQGVTATPDATTLCSVFGIALQRKIDRHGVLAHGIHYLSPEIEQAYSDGARSKVEIRVDPHDLTFITVYLDGEWYPAHAVSDSVWGLSLVEWTEICRNLRLKHKKEAQLSEDVVRRARKAIRAINADAMALRRLKPMTLTTEELERAERELFMSLTIKPSKHVPPVKDAPEGLGLLGDVIDPSGSDGADQDHGDQTDVPVDAPDPGSEPEPQSDNDPQESKPQDDGNEPPKGRSNGFGFRHD